MPIPVVLFPSGWLFATPGALASVPQPEIQAALARHFAGDWGDLSEHDKAENQFALGKNLRLFSAYNTADGTKFWIITEADRSATTILLPHEY